MTSGNTIYRSTHFVRIVFATTPFNKQNSTTDNLRSALLYAGAELIHLGSNRSVADVVYAALEEDVQGVFVSSCQKRSVEYFKHLVDLLRQCDASHVKIFGYGGSTIVKDEIELLQAYGVTKIYSNEDLSGIGLQLIINHIIETMDFSTTQQQDYYLEDLTTRDIPLIAQLISAFETKKNINGHKQIGQNRLELPQLRAFISSKMEVSRSTVIGITGTGGAGKSSLTDELIFRFLNDFNNLKIAIICCDPSKRKSGGALLGDRVRMNSIGGRQTYMRSLATRRSNSEIPEMLPEIVNVLKAASFDIIVVETAGIGQGDSNIIDIVDLALYVMTCEFGAATQLEKIDMLDFADIVVVNKYEQQGGEDAVRDVRTLLQQNMKAFETPLGDMPVYGTMASKFNDDGVTALYHGILGAMAEESGQRLNSRYPKLTKKTSSLKSIIIPSDKVRYLSEIGDTIRNYHKKTEEQVSVVRQFWHFEETARILEAGPTVDGEIIDLKTLKDEIDKVKHRVDIDVKQLLIQWQEFGEFLNKNGFLLTHKCPGFNTSFVSDSLSNIKIPKLEMPSFNDSGELLRWLREENLPGHFPFTAGLYSLNKLNEDPTKIDTDNEAPTLTNKVFKLFTTTCEPNCLSTIYDEVKLFGVDLNNGSDYSRKAPTSEFRICSLDDVKILFNRLSLKNPNHLASITIHGPSPIILAMFLSAVIDQRVDSFRSEVNREPSKLELTEIQSGVFSDIQDTLRVDVLLEDLDQYHRFFSMEFALTMMGDIHEYLYENDIQNFLSTSISGQPISKAGSNPTTQLALMLSYGFSCIEYYLSRGIPIDSFAPNLNILFASSLDPEYGIISRVAQRIWAIAIRKRYQGTGQSQKLKFENQTPESSIYGSEGFFDDIRATIQALHALDERNGCLKTRDIYGPLNNSSSESITKLETVQRKIEHEWRLATRQSNYQSNYLIKELTSLVEEALLNEFDKLTAKGGLIRALEIGYHHSNIQEESAQYGWTGYNQRFSEMTKNNVQDIDDIQKNATSLTEQNRDTTEDNSSHRARLSEFYKRNENTASQALERLKNTALSGDNIFAELINTVRYCSLGQITQALFKMGGRSRCNM